MITATSRFDGPQLTFNTTVSGLAIYLDNWAVIDLAEGEPSRRRRFIAALHSGADLLFSVTNAAELAGPQGESVDAIRTFLDEIGPHWFPVELNPFEVVDREVNGASQSESCLSKRFMKDYFANQFARVLPNSGRVIDLSQDSIRLGAVLDWVGPQRSSILKGAADFDEALIKRICADRATSERDPLWLEQKFMLLAFKPSMPATFTCLSLMRTLIVEAKAYQLKKGDGLDFCHAVTGSAFAHIAALDKHWKRRIESLPKPNGLARIYSALELDNMVLDIESLLARGKTTSAGGRV